MRQSSSPLLRICCATLVAATVIATRASAYPISPVPLWELTQDAEMIVLADVVEVKDPPLDAAAADDENPFSPDAHAVLDVVETWKGRDLTTLVVPFMENLICPAPPRYVVGERVLAFLTRGGGEWSTVGLSYGTLYPAADEVADFRVAVAKARALQDAAASARAKVKMRDRIAWAVEAAARPGTRWHGLYELMPSADEVHHYYDQVRRPLAGVRLTASQLSTLARSFVAAPPTDHTAIMALTVLAPFRDDELDRAAAAVVEAIIALDPVPWWVSDLMTPVFARYGDVAPARRVEGLTDSFVEPAPDYVRGVWERARRELGIPLVAPAPLREQKVGRVGGSTPS